MSRLLTTILVALALLAACGDDDAADDAATDEATDETTDGADETTDDAASDVLIQDFSFVPESVDVPAGTTLSWTNEDGTAHTVTSGTPGEADGTFDESLDSGSTAEISFDEAGTFPYFCAIHPTMTGEVVVS